MVRLLVMTIAVLSLGLTGCQKAKMSKVEKRQENTNPYAYPPGGGPNGCPPGGCRPPGPNGGLPPQQQYPPPGYCPQPGGCQQQPPVAQQPSIPQMPHVPPPIMTSQPEEELEDSGPDITPDDYTGTLNPSKQTGNRPDFGDERNQVDYMDYSRLPRLLDECVYGCEPVKHEPEPEPAPAPAPVVNEPPKPSKDCIEDSNAECEPPKPVERVSECAKIRIPGKKKAQKLDVILMVDTSVSMRRINDKSKKSELTMMAEQMGQFVRQLDPSTDYNIGVMLAHGPSTNKSPNNVYGKLFKSGAGDVAAISISNLINKAKAQGKSDADARTTAEAEVVRILTNKMNVITTGAVNDKSEAQGEVGLLSLYAAVTQQQLTNDIKAEGLFRDDAALNVIFVSDENDACYDYHGREPRFFDKHEKATFDSICATAVAGGRLTEDAVLDALKVLKKNQSVILSAIVYTDVNTLPPINKKIDNDENEQGWGYIDIVQKAHGQQKKGAVIGGLADWGLHDYRAALSQLGKFAQHNIDYEDFVCSTDVKSENIKADSFELVIYTEKSAKNQNPAKIGRFSSKETGSKKITARLNKGEIVLNVDPAELQKVMDKADESGASARITFIHTQAGVVNRRQEIQDLKARGMVQPAVEATEVDGDDEAEVVTPETQSKTPAQIVKPQATATTTTQRQYRGTDTTVPANAVPKAATATKPTPAKTTQKKKKDYLDRGNKK